jgi:hypothetical protein
MVVAVAANKEAEPRTSPMRGEGVGKKKEGTPEREKL